MSLSTKVPSTLAKINAETRELVRVRRANADLRAMEAAAAAHTPRGFRENLVRVGETRPAVIAELKKASPSRGLIRADFDVSALAEELESAGAAALSVLTEEKHFQGSLESLQRASGATRIPCLRKDFIVDDFQVLEARANRADAILLIVASLTDAELRLLYSRAKDFELDVLCEVHDEEELRRAIVVGFDIIGVNNRNLHTFEVSLETSLRLAARTPEGVLRVAESGIYTAEDVFRLRNAGYSAFLVGESLMRQARPGEALRKLIGGIE